MIYIEAPKSPPTSASHKTSVFLAGGITGCRDWQSEVVKKLSKTDLVILNPRREEFDVSDPNASYEQILWEHKYLAFADIISFWFEPGQIQPIVLFELGRWSTRNLAKKIIVGCHPLYPRIMDVTVQLGLEQYDRPIALSIDELVASILWATNEWKFDLPYTGK